ncbi:MAG: hypothetical protein BWX88_03009 [Planctomycetes bacterium ADurb.Bin126]|nr:MAG: hypothetical protein BWX88_03009 [Planctomycetes bacterium ADurb.Bin126]
MTAGCGAFAAGETRAPVALSETKASRPGGGGGVRFFTAADLDFERL